MVHPFAPWSDDFDNPGCRLYRQCPAVLFAGTVVSIAMPRCHRTHRSRLISFDLTGAAVGCLVLIPFLDYFGGPNTVIAAGVVLRIAAAFWFNQADGNLRALAVLVALLLVMLMVVNERIASSMSAGPRANAYPWSVTAEPDRGEGQPDSPADPATTGTLVYSRARPSSWSSPPASPSRRTAASTAAGCSSTGNVTDRQDVLGGGWPTGSDPHRPLPDSPDGETFGVSLVDADGAVVGSDPVLTSGS